MVEDCRLDDPGIGRDLLILVRSLGGKEAEGTSTMVVFGEMMASRRMTGKITNWIR